MTMLEQFRTTLQDLSANRNGWQERRKTEPDTSPETRQHHHAAGLAYQQAVAQLRAMPPRLRRQLNALTRAARYGDAALTQYIYVQPDDTFAATSTPEELDAGLQKLVDEGLVLDGAWTDAERAAEEAAAAEAARLEEEARLAAEQAAAEAAADAPVEEAAPESA